MNKPSISNWRLKVAVLLGISLVVGLVMIVALYVLANFRPTTEIRINSAVYYLELADTPTERQQGLSGVESLKPYNGLLMQFETDGQWGIWMKDMKIPLDIIWLDSTKKVVYIKENVSPELGTDQVMQPEEPSRYVIELSAGSVGKSAIKEGQQVEFTIKGDGE